MNRREFLKLTALGAGALAGSVLWPPAAAAAGARVAMARNAALEALEGEPFTNAVRQLVFTAIADSLGTSDLRQAMRGLFRPDDVVGIKLNCIAPQISPLPEVVYAVVEALALAGVSRKNMIIFDKEDRDLAASGYVCTATGEGPLIYGTVGETKNPGYENDFSEQGKTAFRLSRIVTRECTALVNIPVIKQHTFAGLTCALKNHFGSINNPEDFHYLDGCNPAVADVNLARAIRQKQRLCVVDAIYLQYEGGPSYNARYVSFYGAVMAAQDPVALDTEAVILCDMFRKANGLPPLAELKTPPKHIKTAAEYGLGCGDPGAIQLVVRNA